MKDIALIDDEFINNNTNFSELIVAINDGFTQSEIEVPLRHHHDFSNPMEQIDSTLLMMPAWNPGKDAGVKIVTVSPNNGKYDLPSIQGSYIYLDARKGTLKAILDAKALTAKRTAATSALASSYLSKTTASSLLMIGTGALSKNLILAHTSIRPITKVYVWGRNFNKATEICNELKFENFSIKPIETIEEKISEVDIISCATLSKIPLVFGKFLKKGQHIDLVGAYKPTMREADTVTIQKSSLFVDTYAGAIKEAGDIVIPIQEGTISKNNIKADLFDLCTHKNKGRQHDEEITLFKSVGHAIEDLVAAKYYYKKFKNE